MIPRPPGSTRTHTLLPDSTLFRSGVPADFYVDVAKLAARKGAKLVLDTSGEALKVATAHGVFLIKPSLGELEELVGRKLAEPADQERTAGELVQSGAAEIVALTLGRDGALLATRSGLRLLAGVKVIAKRAVGRTEGRRVGKEGDSTWSSRWQ